MNFDELSVTLYENNKDVGWWDNPDRCIDECMMLVVSEVAEAMEGDRRDLMDSHLPHRKSGEVELADTLIRVLDLGGRFNFKFLEHIREDNYANEYISSWSIGKRYLMIVEECMCFADGLRCKDWRNSRNGSKSYSLLVMCIITVARSFDYDIESAMMEKLEYNKERADHKRENRAKQNGKKF